MSKTQTARNRSSPSAIHTMRWARAWRRQLVRTRYTQARHGDGAPASGAVGAGSWVVAGVPSIAKSLLLEPAPLARIASGRRKVREMLSGPVPQGQGTLQVALDRSPCGPYT